MSDWKEYKLGEICPVITDGSHYSPSEKQNGLPMFSVKDMTDSGFNYDNVKRISESDFEKLVLQGCQPKIGDILIAKDGSVLKHIFGVKSVPNYVLLSSIAILRPNQNIVDFKFLTFLLKSPIITETILTNFVSGSGVPRIVLKDFKTVSVVLPPLPEQTAIAEILCSLDDKIDLLHRQNKTLEQLAETLFRQWFVEEAEEGWEETTLFDSIILVGGGTPKTSILEYWDGNIKWLAGGDIASNHKGFITFTEKTITESGLINSSTKLLPTFSTVISARGTVGKYCILSEPMAFSQSNYGIAPKFENCFFFTYLLIAYSVEELQAAAYGSVFDTITVNTFKEHKIKLPVESQILEFEKSVLPYFQKLKSNTKQINTLKHLKDTLLPKLMSGEIRVKG